MGYTTEFFGRVAIEPALNPAEVEFLTAFAGSRRMDRERGPYFVGGSGYRGQGHDEDVRDFNQPPEDQPGLWCQWVPSEDGKALEWDGGEKFYDAELWMAYLIDHFLRPGAMASQSDDPQFEDFTFDHVLSGDIEAQGEEYEDRWLLRVKDNHLSVLEGQINYVNPQPLSEDE